MPSANAVPGAFILGHSLADGPIDPGSPAVEEFRRSHNNSRYRNLQNGYRYNDLDLDDQDEMTEKFNRYLQLNSTRTVSFQNGSSSSSLFNSSRSSSSTLPSGTYGMIDDDFLVEEESEGETEVETFTKPRSIFTAPVIKSEEASYVSLITGGLNPMDMQKQALQKASKASSLAVEKRITKETREIDSKVQEPTNPFYAEEMEALRLIEASAKRREAAKQRRIKEQEDENKRLKQEEEAVLAEIEAEREAERRKLEEARLAVQREKERVEREAEAAKKAAREAAEAIEKKKKEEEAAAAAQAKKLAAESAVKEGEIIVSPHALEEWKMYRGVLDHINNNVVPAVANNPQIKKLCNNLKREVISIVGQIINRKQDVFRVASDLDGIFTNARNTAGDVAYYWIMNFTAKKMVFQSETECLVKADPAFPLAYAAVLLFTKHELFLDVLMARFAKKCPYVIPMFFKLEPNESANDYLKKLGYRRKDQGWETEEQYNLRQAAMFIFYCAIIQTTPMVGTNLHPLSNGWTWIARIVNVPPRNITARLLAVFLQVCGNSFIRTYKGQAIKILKLVHDDLLPIAPRGGISGETRLKTILDKFKSTGQVPAAKHNNNQHRVTIKRVNDVVSGNMRSTIQKTVARFESPYRREQTGKPLSRIQRQQQQRFERVGGGDGDGGGNRPKKIDAERVPVQVNAMETAFVGDVGIGTPPQYFHLQFDVGSADTWLALRHATCLEPDECGSHRRYFHPNQSSTFEHKPNIPWRVEFGDHSTATGYLQTDLVQVGGFVVDQQVIGMAMTLKGFKDNGIDGTFGLGLTELSLHGEATPVENLVMTKGMQPELGIWLGAGNQGGEIIFGGKDTDRYLDNISYFNVPSGSVYWSTPVKSIVVEIPASKPSPSKKPASAPSNSTTPLSDTPPTIPPAPSTFKQVNSRIGSGNLTDLPNVILDTSSNLILLPPRVALATHQLLHNWLFGWYSGYDYISGAYTIACDHQGDVWIELASPLPKAGSLVDQSVPSDSVYTETRNKFKIVGADLVRERVPVVGYLLNICYSGLQASKSDEDDWVLGNIFFQNNYVTLDHLNRQIGIATAVRLDRK
ncbi:hypothetical protein BGZ83_007759 [Gryganskiella cystojenkinii]|nr:hypothetical protein BGZ83_007759 [Gryganskiella cystojenkinii]